jgi:hypothetical protein
MLLDGGPLLIGRLSGERREQSVKFMRTVNQLKLRARRLWRGGGAGGEERGRQEGKKDTHESYSSWVGGRHG